MPPPDPALSLARRRCTLYVAVVFALSSVFYYLVLTGHSFRHLVTPLMWCPAVSALLVTFATKRPLREFGWRPGGWRWLARGYYFPLLYAAPAYLTVWTTGLGGFPNPKMLSTVRGVLHLGAASDRKTLVVMFVVTATVGIVFGLVGATGEEIGWRGFLVPELSRFLGFRKAAIVSGIVWGLWHLPLIVAGPYAAPGTPRWYQVICFMLMIVSAAVAFAWLRLRSGSLWPAAVFHAAHNSFVQGFFDSATVDTGRTNYFAGEFGIAMVPFVALLALYCWQKGAPAAASEAHDAAAGGTH